MIYVSQRKVTLSEATSLIVINLNNLIDEDDIRGTVKGYGYEDDKIYIMESRTTTKTEVCLKMNGQRIRVYYNNGGGVSDVYKPGNWERYIKEVLYPKALRTEPPYKKRLRESQEEARRRVEESKHLAFAPVDDHDFFSS